MTTLHHSSHNPKLPTPADYSQRLDAWERADEAVKRAASKLPDPEKIDGGTKLVAGLCIFLGLFVVTLACLALNQMR